MLAITHSAGITQNFNLQDIVVMVFMYLQTLKNLDYSFFFLNHHMWANSEQKPGSLITRLPVLNPGDPRARPQWPLRALTEVEGASDAFCKKIESPGPLGRRVGYARGGHNIVCIHIKLTPIWPRFSYTGDRGWSWCQVCRHSTQVVFHQWRLSIFSAIWGLWCQKQVSQAEISNNISQYSVGCN